MKKGILTLVVVALMGFVFLTVGALTAADVPDEVSIQNEGYKSDKKGFVKLTHKTHSTEYKVSCDECHHVYEGGKNVWKEGDPVQKCSECHDPKKKQGKTMKLQNSYHKNCKNCHKAFKKDNPDSKAPFKKCNNCHAKKKK